MEKKYYWLKLGDDFFKSKEIKKLRKVAGGDSYTVVYLKMLLLAIRQNNRLYFEGIEDTFVKELALELDETVENVEVTVSFLQRTGLLVVTDESQYEYMLTQCDEMVGSETDAARRKRRSRQKKMLEDMQKTLPDGKGSEGQLLLAEEKKAVPYTKDFEEFWKVYPRKKEKGSAYKKYMARLNDGYHSEELMKAATAYADEVIKRHTEEKFIKHPKTFLSDALPFLDYLTPSQAGGSNELIEDGTNPFKGR
ncbi:MAG: hypothetical protein HFG34_02455 [Eubacterium sp.]|nr:hypothetical protein [Eubacterium sp.]